MIDHLTPAELASALALPDLTDPRHGPHALQVLLDAIVAALSSSGPTSVDIVRLDPVVPTTDNYDRLGFDPDAVTRDVRYSRYVDDHHMLRSHTSAGIPGILDALDDHDDLDRQLVLPGLVYRRDSIDRSHIGTPHQVDLWRISSTTRLTTDGLDAMIAVLVDQVLPGAEWRAVAAAHPYTVHGRQIDVRVDQTWLELAECGMIAPGLLSASGLDPDRWSGLALGMGLDRALMLHKQIPDIRLLRATDPRIAEQMLDLRPWRPVSVMPAVRRDLSIVVPRDLDAQALGDRVRSALGRRVDDLESVDLLALTAYEDLPEPARRRLWLVPGQANALVRLTLRPLARTLTDAEANELRDLVYLAVHQGPVVELVGPSGQAGRGTTASLD